MEEPVQPSETLSQRVRRTLEDLAAIQQSLHTANTETDGANRESNPVLDLELAAELKSIVDVLRSLLWAYIKVLSAKSGRYPLEVFEWYKLELAVEMLRSRNTRPALQATAETDTSSTFEDLVNTALTVTAMHTGTERRI